MNAILDANIVIAAFLKEPARSPPAQGILKEFREGVINRLFTTSYAMVEAVNFLIRKSSFELALDVYEFFTHTERVTVVYVDSPWEAKIKGLFNKYETLSLTDCSLIVLGEEKDINTLYSFDSGFDKVKSIIRLEK